MEPSAAAPLVRQLVVLGSCLCPGDTVACPVYACDMTDETPTAGICSFCNVQADLVWAQNEQAVALYDGFPLTEGHTLVVPREHVVSLFDLDIGLLAVLCG